MKRQALKIPPVRGGWVRTTISPVNDKNEFTFGITDILMFVALVVGTAAVARVLLAH
jgi:hypothetical protein